MSDERKAAVARPQRKPCTCAVRAVTVKLAGTSNFPFALRVTRMMRSPKTCRRTEGPLLGVTSTPSAVLLTNT